MMGLEESSSASFGACKMQQFGDNWPNLTKFAFKLEGLEIFLNVIAWPNWN